MKDIAVVGLGIAGYTAAVYAARYKLSTVLIGAEEGGMGMTAAEVGNWPGEIEIRGPDLMEKFKNHALSFGPLVEQIIGRVETVERIDDSTALGTRSGFRLTVQGGGTVEAKTVIFATGSNKKHLGVPGETEFAGKGVTYCATCDAFFYKNKTVAVLGGGDAAVEGAAIAAQVAAKVYLVHRRNEFRAEPYWVEKVREKTNITFVLERNVVEIVGEQKVTGVRLDTPFEGQDVLAVDGVFIEIGSTPAVALPLQLGCALDAKGHLQVDEGMRTTVPGIFGAGDVTSGSNHFAQFTTAAGEATVAVSSAFHYLQAGK